MMNLKELIAEKQSEAVDQAVECSRQENVNVAFSILIEAVTTLNIELNNVAERLVRDEELIGLDDESEHPWADDLTITDSIGCNDHAIATLNHNVNALLQFAEARGKRMERIENDINKLKTLMKLADVKSELESAQNRMDAKLDIFEDGMNQRLTRLQEQINKNPEL